MSPKSKLPEPSDLAYCDTSSARIIVCESTGRWAVALRRELGPLAAHLEETRSVIACWDRLAEVPESLIVAEVTTGNLERLLAKMARLESQFPRARVVVVADRRLADHEWLMREIGATMFVTSPRRLAPLAELARRHLAARSSQPSGVLERIWSELPWAEKAERQGP